VQVFTIISTVITVVAAMLALYYAREAIKQAREGQREAHAWRQDDNNSRREVQAIADAARTATLSELQRLHDRMVETHREQMAEHARQRESELRMQRLVALGRVADTLVGLAEVAWNEAQSPPGPAPFVLPPTQLHLMHSRLRAAVAVYEALGGEDVDGMEKLLAELEPYVGGEPPQKFIGLARFALDAIARVSAGGLTT
jgi:hypothetical protein